MGLADARERIIEAPQRPLAPTDEVERIRLAGIDLARSDEARECFLVPLGLEVQQPARIRRLAIIGLDLQRLLEAQQRLIHALPPLQDLAHPVPDIGARIVERHRMVEGLDRLVEAL